MKRFGMSLLATAAFVAATPALSATCADRAQVIAALEERFGETLIANAEAPSGAVMQVYATETVETWSIIVNLEDRSLACLAATGNGREELDQVLAALST